MHTLQTDPKYGLKPFTATLKKSESPEVEAIDKDQFSLRNRNNTPNLTKSTKITLSKKNSASKEASPAKPR